MQKAKSCKLVAINKCVTKVKDKLSCGCTTYINVDNAVAEAERVLAQKKWNAEGCKGNVICPKCPLIGPGKCSIVGGSGGAVGKLQCNP